MPLPSSRLLLQLKTSAIDDVPTFAAADNDDDDDEAGGSEGLTFRLKRSAVESRPRAFWVLPPPSTSAVSAMASEQMGTCSEDDEDEEQEEQEQEQEQPILIAVDAELEHESHQDLEEQRDNLPVSNSARPGILRPNKTAGNRILDPARRVRFADDAQDSSESTELQHTPRPLSTNAEWENVDVEMAPVKQEDAGCALSKLRAAVENSSSLLASDLSLFRVKVEPGHSAVPAISRSLVSSPATLRSSQSSIASGERATAIVVPSIVITPVPEREKQPAIKTEEGSHPMMPLTFAALLSATRDYASECLTLAHLPPDQLFPCFRRLAHHVLQTSDSPYQSTLQLHKGEKETLKRLRDILKNIIEVTAIVKLPPSEVPAEKWVAGRARCMRRLISIIRVIDETQHPPCLFLGMKSQSRATVKVEEGSLRSEGEARRAAT